MKKSTIKKIESLEIRDYQNRDGSYPEAGIADLIQFASKTDYGWIINIEFKNTDAETAAQWSIDWAEKWHKGLGRHISAVRTFDDGDYPSDWMSVSLYISEKRVRKTAIDHNTFEDMKMDR